MSFRKRNVVLGTPSQGSVPLARQDKTPSPGTRPSPLDGRLTTSTGTASFDQILAGHAGLPLGSSVLIEELGNTDFGGILLRYYAAEGLVQGHDVHVLGVGEHWRRELPGLATESDSKSSRKPVAKTDSAAEERMKIAWRYEAFGSRSPGSQDSAKSSNTGTQGSAPFVHSFNLTKKLENSAVQGQLHTSDTMAPLSQSNQSPFKSFIKDLKLKLQSSPSASIHRVVIPSLLSPTVYASSACRPEEALQFLHALRALLRQYSSRLTALITLPISLFPRSTGLVRWLELLSDGVLELVPLQNRQPDVPGQSEEDKSQGMLRAHSLPVFHEKGGGLEGSWVREDLTFKLSSSNGLVITPFSLPPVGDVEGSAPSAKKTEGKSESLDF